MNREKLYKKALKKWGKNAQVNMFFEEVAELTVEICHAGRNDKVAFERDLINELADTEIMLEQMAVMFNIRREKIYGKKKEKLIKLEKMLND